MAPLLVLVSGTLFTGRAAAYTSSVTTGGATPLDATATGVPIGLVGVGIALIASLAFLIAYFLLPRGSTVDELFLVHDSGLLLVHFSKTLRPTKDRDVLVAMLTAVRNFVRDAFTKDPENHLKEMDFGSRKIVICKGSYGYLAVLLRGRRPRSLSRRMRSALAEVEATYRQAIATWDGSAEALTGADDLLVDRLMAGPWQEFKEDLRAFRRWAVPHLVGRAAKPAAPAGPQRPRPSMGDPGESAHTLLSRPELQDLRPEFRDMMTTALQQITEGRFNLTGLANVYMTMTMQKSAKPEAAGWWNLVLRTVREVLWAWPWEPASQSWVQPATARAAPKEAGLAVPLPEKTRPAPAPSPAPAFKGTPDDAAPLAP